VEPIIVETAVQQAHAVRALRAPEGSLDHGKLPSLSDQS
jgi:hypothetical protein